MMHDAFIAHFVVYATTQTTSATQQTTTIHFTMVVKLLDILKELNMTPSCAKSGKGARNERELLRYKAHIGDITKPTSGKWEWNEDDEQLPMIRDILSSYNHGERAPSGWRKLPAAGTNAHADKSKQGSITNSKKRNKESKRTENGVTKKSRRE
jgi:hypothetical protein